MNMKILITEKQYDLLIGHKDIPQEIDEDDASPADAQPSAGTSSSGSKEDNEKLGAALLSGYTDKNSENWLYDNPEFPLISNHFKLFGNSGTSSKLLLKLSFLKWCCPSYSIIKL